MLMKDVEKQLRILKGINKAIDRCDKHVEDLRIDSHFRNSPDEIYRWAKAILLLNAKQIHILKSLGWL